MKIETKYNIGDTLFYMEGDIIRTATILYITIDAEYNILYGGYGISVEEYNIDNDEFYTSKEKLLASLSKQVGVKESPSKTFQRVNEIDVGSSYRR